jgi:TRAP-type mannitol/chloroaromatic compound transport system permease small subunit
VFWAFFINSFNADEGSQNPGGLPNWWLLISTLLVFVGLSMLQGLSHIARSILVLVYGRNEYALVASGH